VRHFLLFVVFIIYFYIKGGMSNCALYLIREWADVTATDKAGNTPLHHAASRGLYKVLSCLPISSLLFIAD